MFWRFGFSSTSSLDTLLDKPNVSLEEILDEDELLQECKTQNSKLLNYLQQPRVLKRLFEHVVGTAEVGGPGGREWEEKVRFKYPYICSEVLACDIWSIVDTALSNSDELLIPFWEAVLGTSPTGSQVSVPHHMHPLFASLPSTEPSSPRLNVANFPTVPGEERDLGDSNVGVLGLEIKREDDKRVTSARDNGPGKSVLAGYWAKVNGVFLDKKPKEMLEFIKAQPRIVEKLVAHLETPAVVDLLYRIIQCEESVPNAGVVDWLSSQDLINRVVDLLSPHHSTDLHNTVSELLKAIIALSAPSPASLTQNAGGAEAFGFGGSEGFGGTSNTSICGVNNRLVRELAGEPVVRKMVGFMLDFSLSSQLSRRLSQATEEQPSLTAAGSDLDRKPSVKASRMSSLSALSENPLRGGTGSSDESALDDEEMEEDRIPRRTPLNPSDTPASGASSVSAESAPSHRDSTATIRPQSVIPAIRVPQVEVTSESCTSSLVTSIGVLIELIRKNNSDYFEQHLFHTLRTHLLQRQQEIAERREKEKGEKGEVSEEEDDEMEGMEEAMAELSDKLGIVHLGPMLQILCERLPDFQELIKQPRSGAHTVPTSLGQVTALTFERYRITELYAELLHCSNMSLLNRARGEGPQYNKDGVLQGGIEGLQILARTLQGGDGASESGDATINDIGVPDAPSNDATKAISSEQPEVEAKSEDEAAIAAAAASSRSHSRDETKHKRESSTTGGGQSNGSEDTDDEALLSEVSLSDAAIAGGKASVVPVAEGGTGVEAAERETKTGVQAKDKENGSKKGADGGIEMALSNLSLAELTSPAPSGPPSPIDEQKKEFVVGDLLKNKFLESNVISTILSLFFQHPWNNFLHNVVYDILQQFFNGRMDVGLNRRLTLAVFDNGELTEKIVEGHQRNENSLQGPRKVRMGYMGHMNLIAEETVKLLERYPDEIEQHVQDHITPEWQAYVNETLKENREKEAAPLAGGRPQMSHPMGFPHQGGGGMELGGGISLGESGDTDAFANYLTSQMGAGNTSDDDDSDEDASWLAQDIKNRSGSGDRASGEHDLESGDGFEDVFEPLSHSGAVGAASGSADLEDDDDDEWGPFADSANVELAEADNQGISSAQAYLTPSQWASDFRRSTSSQTAPAEEEDAASAPTTNAVEGADDEGRRSLDSAESSNSTPLTDMLDGASHLQTDVVAAAHARRPSLGQHETVSSPPSLVGGIELKRRTSSSAGSSDPTAAHATDADEPLGPGVPADARSHEETGLIERIIDGRTIRVPLDDVALVSTQQANESAIVDQEEDEPVPDKAV